MTLQELFLKPKPDRRHSAQPISSPPTPLPFEHLAALHAAGLLSLDEPMRTPEDGGERPAPGEAQPTKTK
jgi:hypothetical protein